MVTRVRRVAGCGVVRVFRRRASSRTESHWRCKQRCSVLMRQGVRNKAGRRDAYASLRAEPAIGDNLLDTRVISSTGGSLRTADA